MIRARRLPSIVVSSALVAGGLGVVVGVTPALSSSATTSAAADGYLGTWSAVGSGTNGLVLALTVAPSTGALFAGGDFSEAGGVSVNSLARWDGSSWSDVAGGVGAGSGQVEELSYVPASNELVVGGTFTSVGSSIPAGNIASWSLAGWSTFAGGVNASANAIAADDTLYVGGSFTQAGGNAANRIAAWNGANWSPLGGGLAGDVYAVAVDDSVYAGGGFTDHIAAWDGAAWSVVGGGVDGDVYALAPSADGLFAGGFFRNAGATAAASIAVLRQGAWQPLATSLGGSRTVKSIVVDESRHLVYVGGEFDQPDGVGASSVAVFDEGLDAWIPLQGLSGQGVPGVSSSVEALAFADDSRASLYIGGLFSQAGGVAANNIAQWTWQAPQGSNAITRSFSDASGFTLTGEGFIGVPATGAVLIGSTPVTYTRDDSGSITVTSWSVSPGTYTITVDGVGGVGAVGTFTHQAEPTPTPTPTPPPPPPPPPSPIPPGPPTDLVAVAGDASVVVTWTPPRNPGSSAITSYEVTGAPSGECRVDAPTTSCEITDLVNGDTYFFIVRAANAAGWSDYSGVSDPVVPTPPPPPIEPAILIAGTRGEVRGKKGVIVLGDTTGFATDDTLIPWIRFPGPDEYTPGLARIRIDDNGNFRWQRRTGKKIYISIRSPDDAVRSNRLILPAAKP